MTRLSNLKSELMHSMKMDQPLVMLQLPVLRFWATNLAPLLATTGWRMQQDTLTVCTVTWPGHVVGSLEAGGEWPIWTWQTEGTGVPVVSGIAPSLVYARVHHITRQQEHVPLFPTPPVAFTTLKFVAESMPIKKTRWMDSREYLLQALLSP